MTNDEKELKWVRDLDRFEFEQYLRDPNDINEGLSTYAIKGLKDHIDYRKRVYSRECKVYKESEEFRRFVGKGVRGANLLRNRIMRQVECTAITEKLASYDPHFNHYLKDRISDIETLTEALEISEVINRENVVYSAVSRNLVAYNREKRIHRPKLMNYNRKDDVLESTIELANFINIHDVIRTSWINQIERPEKFMMRIPKKWDTT